MGAAMGGATFVGVRCLELSTMSRTTARTIFWLCYKVAAPNLKGILRHMAAVHAHDPSFRNRRMR